MKVELGPYPANSRTRRKISVKIHAYDAFSADTTLAIIVAPLVKRVKADNHGVPVCFLPNDYNDHDPASLELASKKWDEILDKIIWAMEQIANCEPNSPELTRAKGVTRKEGHKRFWKRLEGELNETPEEEIAWEDYREKTRAYHIRVQEGCELFGKYFQNLWT
jgi:hypothetical protein